MHNLELLLEQNKALPSHRIEIRNGSFHYRAKNSTIGAEAIRDIIGFINTLFQKYPGVKLPIIFNLGSIKFADKLSYILLECICFHLIANCGYRVIINCTIQSQIHTAGIKSSPLLLLSTGRSDHLEKFKTKFTREIYGNHYRRLVLGEDLKKPDFLCSIMDDVAWFQSGYHVDPDCREAISEVIIELVGNASEHGEHNCLIDFDIAETYFKKGSPGEFVGINIVIANFSQKVLGSALRDRIITDRLMDGRFSLVQQAYAFHSQHFGDKYTDTDFFNMTAFQHKISGRCGNICTGGTGLTKLIESLESRSDDHMCYVTSGERAIVFKHDYLKYNDAGWLGFNPTNDYFSAIPDLSIFRQNLFSMPGTAYNLNFVMQKENSNE